MWVKANVRVHPKAMTVHLHRYVTDEAAARVHAARPTRKPEIIRRGLALNDAVYIPYAKLHTPASVYVTPPV